MANQKWLISWIGEADKKAPSGAGSRELGPIAGALLHGNVRYDRVCLLNNFDHESGLTFCKWLEEKCRYSSDTVDLQKIDLVSPIDYDEIYREVCKHLSGLGLPREDVELTYHLSPGTPAMATIWVMLSRTRFPAGLIQTTKKPKDAVFSVNPTFDLAGDFFNEYLTRSSARINEISANADKPEAGFEGVIFNSPGMKKQIKKAQLIAAYEVPVLILGETGTGKEKFAQAIHTLSSRSAKELVPVNCGAIATELANSELFGHKKGSFTGADKDKEGFFQAANGSTLFLDEIGDLPLDTQVRLLRALQSGEITPVGSTKSIKVDVRVVAATHKNLENEVLEGRFREDLYYRLAVGKLLLPPLRERGEDIDFLVDHFLEKINSVGKGKPEAISKTITPEARKFLREFTWPGNIRQLYNVLQSSAIWSRDSKIEVDDVREELAVLVSAKPKKTNLNIGTGIQLNSYLNEIRVEAISQALTLSGGHIQKASNLLGIQNYQTLTRLMKTLGIQEKP